MSSLARVLNGIHIQQALINGTIPPEKLVAELLNLGSTTFKDIESVDIEEVEKLAESMNGLHSMIQDDSEVEWLERRPEMWPILQTAPHFGDIRHPWTRVRAYSEILDVAALGNDDYMKELKAFKANIAEEQNREKLAEKITNLFNAILELRKTDLADAEIKTKISWIVSVLEEFVTIDLAPYEAAKYQQLRQGDVAFSSLATIWALLSPQKSVLPVSQDKPIIESITGLLGNLSTVATSVTISAIRDCRIMCHLFVSSSNRNETAKLEYTYGFPNGVSDLEMMISKDLTNKWINKTTKGNAGKLAKALSQLANLTENLKSIDQSMRLGSSDSNGVSDYCQELASLASIANQTDLVAKHISEIASFNIPNDLSPSNGEKIDALLAAIDGLRGTLYSIDEMIKLVRIHKDSNSFAKMLEIFKKSSLEEIRTGAEVKRFIETAEKRMSAMYHLHYHHLADKIDGIAANYTEINAYFTGLAPFFDKIQEMKKIEGAESLKGVLDQIKEFRSKRRYEISSDLFLNLADLKNQTKKLEELIEKTKGFKSLETDELMSKRSIEKEAVYVLIALGAAIGIGLLATGAFFLYRKLLKDKKKQPTGNKGSGSQGTPKKKEEKKN
uniref:WSN domain-containing protein n=1 Tax=Caenorhabditis tropicalis TaxID=1561998 RepID=A0A1I7UUU9_9PELO